MKSFLTNRQQSALVDLEGEYESAIDTVNGRFSQPTVEITAHDVHVASFSIKRSLASLRALLEDRGAWETIVEREVKGAFARVLEGLVQVASDSDIPTDELDGNIEVAPITYCGAMWTFEAGPGSEGGGGGAAYLVMVFQAGFRIGHLMQREMAS